VSSFSIDRTAEEANHHNDNDARQGQDFKKGKETREAKESPLREKAEELWNWTRFTKEERSLEIRSMA